MYEKRKILTIEAVFTANAFRNESGFYIGAGSETGEEAYLYDLARGEASPIPRNPGGMKSFVPVPGKPDLFISVQGMYPDYRGEEAGIYMHTRMGINWESGKAFDLPFAQCCEILSVGEKHFLVAGTASIHKSAAGDWSKPGELHIIDLEQCELRKWRSTVIDNSIYRIHSMFRTQLEGKEAICVSGMQGIYCPLKEGDRWRVDQIFFGDVSEMAFYDLDGDGNNELITIEPYHGDTLNVYKKDGANWIQKFSAELSGGHGLSAGMFRKKPIVVVGNLKGTGALESFVVVNLQKGIVERNLIEEGAGPTQTDVFAYNSKDYILSSNRDKGEVCLYS